MGQWQKKKLSIRDKKNAHRGKNRPNKAKKKRPSEAKTAHRGKKKAHQSQKKKKKKKTISKDFGSGRLRLTSSLVPNKGGKTVHQRQKTPISGKKNCPSETKKTPTEAKTAHRGKKKRPQRQKPPKEAKKNAHRGKNRLN